MATKLEHLKEKVQTAFNRLDYPAYDGPPRRWKREQDLRASVKDLAEVVGELLKGEN